MFILLRYSYIHSHIVQSRGGTPLGNGEASPQLLAKINFLIRSNFGKNILDCDEGPLARFLIGVASRLPQF